jgi:hypothetical protein
MLSALRTNCLYPQENIFDTYFGWIQSRTHRHNATGRIMSMKNSKNFIGIETATYRACSAGLIPTEPPRTTHKNQERK